MWLWVGARGCAHGGVRARRTRACMVAHTEMCGRAARTRVQLCTWRQTAHVQLWVGAQGCAHGGVRAGRTHACTVVCTKVCGRAARAHVQLCAQRCAGALHVCIWVFETCMCTFVFVLIWVYRCMCICVVIWVVWRCVSVHGSVRSTRTVLLAVRKGEWEGILSAHGSVRADRT